MARIILKVTRKPAVAAPGGMSSRAKRAQMQNQQRRPPAAKPVDVAPAPAAAPRTARVATPDPQGRPRTDQRRRRGTLGPGDAVKPRAVPVASPARPPRHANPDDPRL